jgi:radical SAM superfamily enzyme YgiQ (UPF0313 family)
MKVNVHPIALGPDQFAPSEFFSSFYPLGCLLAYAKTHAAGELHDAFEFGKITPKPAREIPAIINELSEEPPIFLLSSYVWNHAVNMRFGEEAKRRWPGCLVVVGGPHVPRMALECAEFLRAHPFVDVAVRHEGEITLAEILQAVRDSRVAGDDLTGVDLSSVSGVTHRRDGKLVRTPDRARTMELAAFPSPYTTGEYDHWIDGRLYVPLETNRGCPYGCTFCDWGAATLSKIARFSMERVLGEIEFAAKKRIHTIGFCDANFGILSRDVEIVHYVIEMAQKHGYPRAVGYSNAKSAKPRVGEIIKLLHDAGLTTAAQIALQTIDEQVLKNVDRANIKTSEYRKMIAFFHEHDIPAVSDMMIGMPGQTLETCKHDLQFFFDHRVAALVFATTVMPNAPMADEAYRKKFKIELDEDGFVASTYSFTQDEYAQMFELCLAYKLLVKIGVLKYLLYYVQIEHGLKAMDFLAQWVTQSERADLYPISHRIKRTFLDGEYRGGRKDWLILSWSDSAAAFLFDALGEFYQEIIAFLAREHGIAVQGSDADAVLCASRAVMPLKGRSLPASIPLEHDVPAYFAALRGLPTLSARTQDHKPLRSYEPGKLELSLQRASDSYQHADAGPIPSQFELTSNLRI